MDTLFLSIAIVFGAFGSALIVNALAQLMAEGARRSVSAADELLSRDKE